MNSSTEHCIDVCNRLLRGELSAIETYRKAIETHGETPIVDELLWMQEDHMEAAEILSRNVLDMGGTPDTSSGAWGVFANTVQGAADILGTETAIDSLQRGEEHGLRDYEDALADEDVMPSCKQLIRDELIPPTTRHISTLERLEQAA